MATVDSTHSREHYWDVIRGGLLLLGLPYHAALVYDPHSRWAVHSLDGSPSLAFLCEVLHSFRMPVFFMMAGYFSYMLLSRREPRAWIRNRMVRLGVPLLTGALFLNPIQMVASAQAQAINGLIPPNGIVAAVIHSLTTLGGQWIRHLWFLEALIVYSVLLVLVFPALNRLLRNPVTGSLSNRIFGSAPLFLGVLIACAGTWVVGGEALFWAMTRAGIKQPLAGMLNLEPIVANLPFFAIGVLAQGEARAKSAFRSGGAFTVITAIALSLLYAVTASSDTLPYKVVAALLTAAAGVTTARALISVCARKMDRPNPHILAIVDASFTIYLLHQPFISILGTAFLLLAWPPILEFMIIVAVTLLLSYGCHLLIRRSELLLFAFNGVQPKRPKPSPASRLISEL